MQSFNKKKNKKDNKNYKNRNNSNKMIQKKIKVQNQTMIFYNKMVTKIKSLTHSNQQIKKNHQKIIYSVKIKLKQKRFYFQNLKFNHLFLLQKIFNSSKIKKLDLNNDKNKSFCNFKIFYLFINCYIYTLIYKVN